MREMALRGKPELVADVGYRCLRAHQSIERPLDTHRICVKGGCYAGVLPKKLEEMRTGETGIARHGVEFDALGDAVVQEAERFADAKIDRRFAAARRRRAYGPSPRTRRNWRRRAGLNSDGRSDNSPSSPATWARLAQIERSVVPTRIPLVAEAEASAALLVAIEPAIADIGDQKDRWLLGGTAVEKSAAAKG